MPLGVRWASHDQDPMPGPCLTLPTFSPPCLPLPLPARLSGAGGLRRGGATVAARWRRGRLRAALDDPGIGKGGYVPSEDDRPEGVSEEIPTELTLAQQLLMKQYVEQVNRMSAKECQDLAVEIVRQMMVKDNILRTMLKKEINLGVEPPDPEDFLDNKDDDKDDDKFLKT